MSTIYFAFSLNKNNYWKMCVYYVFVCMFEQVYLKKKFEKLDKSFKLSSFWHVTGYIWLDNKVKPRGAFRSHRHLFSLILDFEFRRLDTFNILFGQEEVSIWNRNTKNLWFDASLYYDLRRSDTLTQYPLWLEMGLKWDWNTK